MQGLESREGKNGSLIDIKIRKGKEMNQQAIRRGFWFASACVVAGLALAQVSAGRGISVHTLQQNQQPQQQGQPAPSGQPAQAGNQQQAEPPKSDPAEETAYKAFHDTNQPQDIDKDIQLGEQFVQKYPNSKYDEAVYSGLTHEYFTKQQLDKMYAAADKALALNPDDVTVLVLVGWVIPHNYDPNDLEADRKLDKAEGYEKHALELLGTMTKPPGVTDEQFATAKASALSQAHSGLGLIYFRKQDFENSVKELKLAESAAANPDPTDFYVMGISLQQLKRYSEAADAFTKCAQIPGGLADRCKQSADQAKKQAAGQPAQPK
jgi:tetratricopeptide (TPR) repeat protein